MGGKVGGRSTTPFHQGDAANNLMNNPSPKTSGGKHERKKNPPTFFMNWPKIEHKSSLVDQWLKEPG